MKVAIGCDHAGYDLKEKIIKKYNNFEFIDCGAFSLESVDYPSFGHKVGSTVINSNDCSSGIVICGSGIGISIAVNKIKNIRAALCTTVEHARLSRLHNDANVLALGARLTDEKLIYKIIDSFFNTKFEGGRHQDRINKIEI